MTSKRLVRDVLFHVVHEVHENWHLCGDTRLNKAVHQLACAFVGQVKMESLEHLKRRYVQPWQLVTHLLYGLVLFHCDIGDTRVEHEREEICNEVSVSSQDAKRGRAVVHKILKVLAKIERLGLHFSFSALSRARAIAYLCCPPIALIISEVSFIAGGIGFGSRPRMKPKST